jgi:maltose-binding protein MalE
MRNIKKSLISTALVLGLVTPLVSCGNGKNSSEVSQLEGELTVMMWSGDGSYIEDIGHKTLSAEELFGQNQAAAYAVARAFNQIYPNVKINVYAKQGDPNGEGLTWNQHIENFKNEYGHYPSVYAAMDLPGDVSRGMVADLSRFKDDAYYKSFNKSVMSMMNYYGFQAGLPQFLQPWGVYVNKSLADEHNIEVPDPDWTIEEYTEFVLSADAKTFWGAMDTPLSFIKTGVSTYVKSLFNYDGTGDYVNVNSDEIKDLLDYYIQWTDNSIWTSWDKGEVTEEEMISMGSWWSFNYFKNGYTLTLDGDPWMMGDLAHPDKTHELAATFDDWDIYPRPSTDYAANTVGVVLDPMAVHNFCIDDGNPECTEEENKQIELGYKFMSFWVGDTRAWKARAEQQFQDGLVLKTSLNDSLPLVTGKAFDEQMEIWYSVPTHQRFKDANKMPGWQKVLDIWEKGQIWDVSDKAYPWRTTDENGAQVVNALEFENMWSPDYVNGVARFEEAWKGTVLTLLPTWNETINARFEKSFNELKYALKEFYFYKDSDFLK